MSLPSYKLPVDSATYTPPNTVSWSSAFWALTACTLATTLQKTGRVCGASPCDSFALRSSPFVCILDAAFMVCEAVWLCVKGCGARTAARHVWWNRFTVDDDGERDEDGAYDFELHRNAPGSGIDPAWRYSVASFALGAVPQGVKVFGMRGIPLTQTLVAFLLVSFVVPESFRIVAGPARTINLRPMPSILRVNQGFAEAKVVGLWVACGVGWGFSYFCLLKVVVMRPNGAEDGLSEGATTFVVAPPLGFVIAMVGNVVVYAAVKTVGRWKGVLDMEAKLKKWIQGMYAISSDVPDFALVFVVIFPLSVMVATLCMVSRRVEERSTVVNDDGTIALIFLSILSLFTVPVQLAAFHIVFRLVFMGSLSSTPRKLFGLEGQTSEFVSGAFVVANLFFAFVGYVYCDPFYVDTYKPDWAEWLG